MIKHILHNDIQDTHHDIPVQTSSAVNGFVDQHGTRKYDATMGWFSYPLGFQRHDIIDYVASTLKQIAFDSPDGHMSSTVRQQLSDKLYQLTPGYYSVFGLSGSDAIECAIYTSGLYHSNVQKKIILSLETCFHGSTDLCASISGIVEYQGTFKYSRKIPNVNYERFGKHAERMFLYEFKNTIDSIGADNISCFVIESSSWSGGLYTYSKQFWQGVQDTCRQNNILLIIDDIAMCGGKTGQFFGVNFDLVEPDIVCASKALTGGYFPLSVTLLSERVYNQIKTQRFEFGLTYSACVAGMASAIKYISILEQENILEQVPTSIVVYQTMFDQFQKLGVVEYYRNFGTMFLVKFVDRLDYEFAYQELDLYHPVALDQNQYKDWMFSLPLVDSKSAVKQLSQCLNSFSLNSANA
jgi:adenosylmethionine-8-amino-7-oxononanoate aminotransferase